ncbi:hypothetical protein LY90DRAFT_701879 [Neocallimastix californiae]|uniref:Transcription factor CBF/NF-Y/archaeal histone domain-containing protein n=1 Tax=Neocallimastix californiae TaxID=1754190 RepID=A0A1Y2D9P5_9FUNG|nr:hypothetical protein LY90DRAFT_701879 [Neocallimastix californiae]|eukprot:ORY55978.1 hypothetical protein LY90DRAFT_701879 [Neocallimastix californiae]
MSHKESNSSKSGKEGSSPKKRSLPQTTSSFPLARVKRIMKEDKDVIQISNESVFLVSLATNILQKKSFGQSQGEKRRTVTYKDVARVVKDVDQLEFLLDVVPETIPFKKALQKQKEIKGIN